MIVAIHQPNYIPWLGFFHKMNSSDIFILLDNVKHSKSSYTHRNSIKSNDKELLISIPLKNKESLINELIISDPKINLTKHWRIIESNYRKAKNWKYLYQELEEIFNKDWYRLVELNNALIKLLKDKLEISTQIIIASDLENIEGEGSDRNLNICKRLNASVYLSGSGARAYNNEESFKEAEIKIQYNQFVHPEYSQLGDNFIHRLSVIDLLFNCGSNSINILKNS